MNHNFLLNNKTAERLYHEVVAHLPIIDYHNHLNPQQLAHNKAFENITQLWIANDPYKHRAMRISGIAEKYITGESTDEEKFFKWAEAFPNTLGNPLYHWTCMELQNLFGIEEILSAQSARNIWNTCNSQLNNGKTGILDILAHFKVETTCTSDDLLDDLSHHQAVTADNIFGIQVLPSLRGDSILKLEQPGVLNWLKKLSDISIIEINSPESYKEAIIKRLNYFDESGCLLADHALDAGFYFEMPSEKNVGKLLGKHLQGGFLSTHEQVLLQSYLLVFLGEEYGRRGWVMQLHIGAQRYTSSRLCKLAGAAGGYATIGKPCDIDSICRFLDILEQKNKLPKTILYTLNPADNEALATLTGSFAEDGVPGKIQFGPAWWYNDHLTGIESHLITLAGYGLLNHFIGMTTDSRSALSFTRHEYFRRIVCNMLGKWAKSGQITSDIMVLNTLITNICYNNSKNWIVKNKLYEQSISTK